MTKRIASYSEFWPHYLREHAQPVTRQLHYIGSVLAIGVVAYAIITQTWLALVAAPLSGYFFAWLAHAWVERNRPATFTHPLWSLISDYRMLWRAITGKLDGDLQSAGVTTP